MFEIVHSSPRTSVAGFKFLGREIEPRDLKLRIGQRNPTHALSRASQRRSSVPQQFRKEN